MCYTTYMDEAETAVCSLLTEGSFPSKGHQRYNPTNFHEACLKEKKMFRMAGQFMIMKPRVIVLLSYESIYLTFNA